MQFQEGSSTCRAHAHCDAHVCFVQRAARNHKTLIYMYMHIIYLYTPLKVRSRFAMSSFIISSATRTVASFSLSHASFSSLAFFSSSGPFSQSDSNNTERIALERFCSLCCLFVGSEGVLRQYLYFCTRKASKLSRTSRAQEACSSSTPTLYALMLAAPPLLPQKEMGIRLDYGWIRLD